MPRHRFTKVVIPLYFQGHAYRAGSRIRVTISAPGGEQPIWSFAQARPRGKAAKVRVASSRRAPLAAGAAGGAGSQHRLRRAACPSLRNEPCRDYPLIRNR